MTRGYLLLPYRQGHLDGLCGIYAIINAIRVVLGDPSRHISTEAWQELYAVLMLAVDETVGAATAAGCGIETKPLLHLLSVAARHMADEHEIELTVTRLLKRRERPPLRKVLPRLARISEEPNTAILVSFLGHLDHWTVLRRVSKTSIAFFDSSGFKRVVIANCRMTYERPTPTETSTSSIRGPIRIGIK